MKRHPPPSSTRRLPSDLPDEFPPHEDDYPDDDDIGAASIPALLALIGIGIFAVLALARLLEALS
jgi:hypothetical protein